MSESQTIRRTHLWPCVLFVLATLAVNTTLHAVTINSSAWGMTSLVGATASGLMCGELCLCIVISGLCGRHWLTGYAAGTALATAGTLSLVAGQVCYTYWLDGYTDFLTFISACSVPPVILLSSTLLAFRRLQGWRLTRQASLSVGASWSIADLIVGTALVAALVMLGRTTLFFTELPAANYWLPIAVISLTFCLISLAVLAPTLWILFRSEKRRLLKLIAMGVVCCFLSSIVYLTVNEFWRPRIPAQMVLASAVLFLGAAFGYLVVGLSLLRLAGFRLHIRADAMQSTRTVAESTESVAQRWTAPAVVLSCFVTLQLILSGLIFYRESQAARGRELQREMAARGGRVEVGESGDVWGITLTPTATRDEIRRLINFPNLQYVNLSGTAFEDADLELLRPLAQLGSLDLSNTLLTDAGLDEIAGWSNVLSLSVAGTKCTAAGLRKFVAFHPLYKLDVGYLNLTDADVNAIASAIMPRTPQVSGRGRVASEIRLDLSGNPITNDGLAFLKDKRHMWSLELKDCAVDEGALASNVFMDLNLDGTGIDNAFARCAKTLGVHESLSMDRTLVTDAVLPSLSGGTIRHLKLGETQITEQGLSGLGLNGPTELSLNSKKFTGVCFAKWKPNLRILNMNHSGVTDAEIEQILSLPQLFSLSLSDTEVTDASLDAIAQSQLDSVDLSATHVTATGLAKRKWVRKSITIAADQFTEPEIRMLLKLGRFNVVPPVQKR